MLNIGVVGFSGRVNKIVIEEITKDPGCAIAGIYVRSSKVNNSNKFSLYDDIIKLAEVSDSIIDFSSPQNTLEIAKKLKNSGKLLVSGTTGFTSEEFKQFMKCAEFFPIIWSANMSIGVNLLHRLLKVSAPILGEDFDSAIIDIHHKHKKDSPSGTALSLAKNLEECGHAIPQISSLRIGEEFGSHEIIFSGKDESISFKHRSFSRNSYAKGAIKACFWGHKKTKGFFSMQDVFGN